MESRKIRSYLILFAVSLLLTGRVMALGIGAISPQSQLNQPFLALIPINSASQDELDSLQISLGNLEQFKLTGIPRPFLLALLKFTVIHDAQGQPFIKIYSQQAIQEPFLEFLVDYEWNKGKLLQKYTVLLDPVKSTTHALVEKTTLQPATTVNIPQGEMPPPPIPPAVVNHAPEPEIEAKISAPEIKPAMSTGEPVYGPISDTDTLWSIASATRPDTSVSIHQMMLAILHTNPGAFSKPNVHNLIKGKTLRIPSLAEIMQIDKTTAKTEVKLQSDSTSR